MDPILLGDSTPSKSPTTAPPVHPSLGRINSWHLGSKMWAFVPSVIIINKSKCREMLSLYNRRKFILVNLNQLSQHPQL